jgi:hypothetical protein
MAITNGTNLNAVPAPAKQTLQSNYIDFTSSATAGWAQQYLPELMEEEAEVFGNRSISGFLEMVGAEEAMTSDQVVWSEQGRLHLSYTGTTHASTDGLILLQKDADGNDIDAAGEDNHGVRVGDTVLVTAAAATVRCYVSAVDNTLADVSITVKPYSAATLNAVSGISTSTAVSVFVYGSEFKKGTLGRTGANTPGFKTFTNNPIIMKDKYEVSGSDASQIGWVEVSGEEGQNGYLWYLKAAGDTRARFTDYCEMALIEAEKAAAGSEAAVAGLVGTEGLFAALEDRGNLQYGNLDLSEFDVILKEFDSQGAIEEYMMFLNRTEALYVDDMLAGLGDNASGSAYGVFDNDANMALNLGFTGFRRGSYDFYKTDWKYLNDKSTRGSLIDATAAVTTGKVSGVMVPAGTSSVYDQSLGRNLRRPFLHVRYRASQMDDRRFKTWTTGSVGAATSDLDAMEMHFLTERCLVVQGANNFMLLKG